MNELPPWEAVEASDTFKALSPEDKMYHRTEYDRQAAFPEQRPTASQQPAVSAPPEKAPENPAYVPWDKVTASKTFKSAKPEDQKYYRDEWKRQYQPEERSFPASVGSHIMRGVARTASMVGHGLELADLTPTDVDTEQGLFDKAGKAIRTWGEEAPSRSGIYRPDIAEQDKGFFGSTFGSAVESAPLMAVPFAMAKGGAMAGTAVGGPVGAAVGGVGGGLLGLVGTFFAGTYGESRKEALSTLKERNPDMTDEEIRDKAHAHGMTSGLYEAVPEAASDILMYFTAGGSKLVTEGGKAAISSLMKGGPKEFGKRVLKGWAKNAPMEAGTEMLTEYGQKKSEMENLGVGEGAQFSDYSHAAGAALWMALGANVAGTSMDEIQSRQAFDAVNSENPESRIQAASYIAGKINESTGDSELAENWQKEAVQLINDGQEIPTGERIDTLGDKSVTPTDPVNNQQDLDAEISKVEESLLNVFGETGLGSPLIIGADQTGTVDGYSPFGEDEARFRGEELMAAFEEGGVEQTERQQILGDVELKDRTMAKMLNNEALTPDEEVYRDSHLEQIKDDKAQQVKVDKQIVDDAKKRKEFLETSGVDVEANDMTADERHVVLETEREAGFEDQAMEKMLSDVEAGAVSGSFQDEEGTTTPTQSSYPEWFKQKTVKKYNKEQGTKVTLSKDTLKKLVVKIRSGKELTARQQETYDYLQTVSSEYLSNDPELVASQEYVRLEDEGFKLGAPENVSVGNLNPGDEIVVEKGGVPDKLTHMGYDKDGNAMLQDGQLITADEFDTVDVISSKVKGESADRKKVDAMVMQITESSTIEDVANLKAEMPSFIEQNEGFKPYRELILGTLERREAVLNNDLEKFNKAEADIAKFESDLLDSMADTAVDVQTQDGAKVDSEKAKGLQSGKKQEILDTSGKRVQKTPESVHVDPEGKTTPKTKTKAPVEQKTVPDSTKTTSKDGSDPVSGEDPYKLNNLSIKELRALAASYGVEYEFGKKGITKDVVRRDVENAMAADEKKKDVKSSLEGKEPTPPDENATEEEWQAYDDAMDEYMTQDVEKQEVAVEKVEITKANGEPFKSRVGAKSAITKAKVEGYEVVKVDGGYVGQELDGNKLKAEAQSRYDNVVEGAKDLFTEEKSESAEMLARRIVETVVRRTYKFKDKKQPAFQFADDVKTLGLEEKGVALRIAESVFVKSDTETATVTKEYFSISKDDIPKELARQAHLGTSMVPDRRADQEQEGYVQYMNEVIDDLLKLATTDKQKEDLKTWFNDYFKPGYIKREKARLQANARTMSSMITGPANFPVAANKRKMETADSRSKELIDFANKAVSKMERKLSGKEAISSTDPKALDKLNKKLDALETNQEKMKAANKIVRNKKLSDEEKISQVIGVGFPEEGAKGLLEPDFAGRLGFPPFSLTNNNAKIKTVKGRIKTLESRQEKAKETGGKESKEFEGGRVEINYEDGFLRVFHDEKPSADVRKNLKSNGFRWSPRDVAWRRKITNPAKWAAEKVTGVKFSKAGKPKESKKSKFKGDPNEFTINEKNRIKTKTLERAIKRKGEEITITPVSVPDDAFAGKGKMARKEAPKTDYDIAERLAKIFGKKVVWVRIDGDFQLNGAVFPGAKEIFIDVRSTVPSHAVLGHELSHHMEKDNPAAYRKLLEAVSPLIKNTDKYRDKLDLWNSSDESIRQEILGDLLGDSFTDSSFWADVARQNPSGFRKIANTVMRWLNSLIKKLGSKSRSGFASDKYITDIRKARVALAQATGEYATQKKGATAENTNVLFSEAFGDVGGIAKDVSASSNAFKEWGKKSLEDALVYAEKSDDLYPPDIGIRVHTDPTIVASESDISEYGLKEPTRLNVGDVVGVNSFVWFEESPAGDERNGVSVFGVSSKADIDKAVELAYRLGVGEDQQIVVLAGEVVGGGLDDMEDILGDAKVLSVWDGRSDAEVKFSAKPRMPKRFMDAAKKVTDTANFKKWFGTSKIKSNGEPHILYHGTSHPQFLQDKDYPWVFDTDRAVNQASSPLAGLGIFLGNDTIASAHSTGTEGITHPFFVKVENPLVIASDELESSIQDVDTAKAFRKRKELQGYDGIIIKDRGHVIAFNANQLKSASQNTGEFSEADPDVRYSAKELSEKQQAFSDKIGGRVKETLKEKFDKAKVMAGAKLRQGIVDQFSSFKSVLKDKDAYMMGHLTKSDTGVLMTAVKVGTPFMDESGAVDIKEGSKSLQGILKPLGDDVDTFFKWLVAHRAEKLAAEDRENLFTADEIEAGKTLNEGNEELFSSVLKDFEEMGAAITDIAVKTNLINKEEAQKWKDEGLYIPFYRILEEQGESKGAKNIGGLSGQKGFTRLKGGTANIDDPLTNVLNNWSHLISAGLRNQAAKKAIETAASMDTPLATRITPTVYWEQDGDTYNIQGVDSEISIEVDGKKATSSGVTYPSLAKAKTAIHKQLIAAGEMNDGDQLKGTKSKNSIYVRDNGKEIWYELDQTPEGQLVLDSLSSLNYEGMNGVAMKGLRMFKRALTTGVTASPGFKIRNLIRDSLHAPAVSTASKNPLKNILVGVKNKAAMSRMVAGGGAFSQEGYIHGTDPEAKKRLVGIASKSIIDTPHKLKQLWRKYENFGATLENINRVASFEKDLAAGKSLLEANFNSRDQLDFARTGTYPSVRIISQTVPFLNARLQGLDKMARAVADKDQQKQFAQVVGMYSMASVALMLLMAGDKDYDEAEEWEKRTYHLFKAPGSDTMFRLPRPFEVGAIAYVAEQMTKQFVDGGENPKELGMALLHTINDTFAMNPIPQAFKPVMELYANKSMFTGRDIESQSMQRLSKKERFKPWTSDTAKGISGAMSAVMPESVTLSPVQIQHAVRAYTGWVGATVLASTDFMIKKATGKVTPETKLSEYKWNPLESLSRDAEAKSTKYMTKFYDNLSEIDREWADIRKYRGTSSGNRTVDRMKLKYRKSYGKANKKLAALRKRSQSVYDNDNLSASVKRNRIKAIDRQKNLIAKRMVTISESAF